jgi:hypothetical protein
MVARVLQEAAAGLQDGKIFVGACSSIKKEQ